MTRISIPALRRALDRRQLREADIDHGLYVAPRGARGEHIVEYPIGSGNQVHVGSALQGQTFAPGTAVPLGSHTGDSRRLIIGGPPSGRRGISQFPVDAPPPGQLESVGIIAAAPATVESGASAEPTTLTGYGFRATDTFEAVRQTSSGWEVDPLVTVATVSIDDSETAQVTLTVSSSAPAGYAISFRPVGRLAIGPDLVRVVASTCPALGSNSYIGIVDRTDIDTLYAYEYVNEARGAEIANFNYSSLLGTRSVISTTYHRVHSQGDILVFRAVDAIVTWNLSTNSMVASFHSANIAGWTVVGTTVYLMSTGTGATKAIYSTSVGSSSPPTLYATMPDVSSGAGWWQYAASSIIPAGSRLFIFGRDNSGPSDEFYVSDVSTLTGKYHSIGTSTEADRLYWTSSDGIGVVGAGVVFPGGQCPPGNNGGPVTCFRFIEDGTYVKLIPCWNLQGTPTSVTAASDGDWVVHGVAPDALNQEWLMRVPTDVTEPFGAGCDPPAVLVERVNFGAGGIWPVRNMVPR